MNAGPGAMGLLWLWDTVADRGQGGPLPGSAVGAAGPHPARRAHGRQVRLYPVLTATGSALVDSPSE